MVLTRSERLKRDDAEIAKHATLCVKRLKAFDSVCFDKLDIKELDEIKNMIIRLKAMIERRQA